MSVNALFALPPGLERRLSNDGYTVDIENVLNNGTYGAIVPARHKRNGAQFVAKVSPLWSPEHERCARNEINGT